MASPKRSRQKRKKSLKFPYTFKLIFSLLLIIFGAGTLIWSVLQKIPWQVQKQTTQEQIGKLDYPRSAPLKLYIPRLSKVLYISDGYVADGDRWAISETGVSYLITSALPGQVGNAVIYGHNTQNILGGLWRVQDGDIVYVVMDSGDFVKYQIFEKKEIQPTQVEILNQTEDSRLTIYTCSGFLDQARFVVVSKLI